MIRERRQRFDHLIAKADEMERQLDRVRTDTIEQVIAVLREWANLNGQVYLSAECLAAVRGVSHEH